MTIERLREIADNVLELRALADDLDRNKSHTCWVWNRRIIEAIRAAVPDAPALDEDLADAIRATFNSKRELKETADLIWRGQMSSQAIAGALLDLITKYVDGPA